MAIRQKTDREELTPVEARQGFLDKPVLTILIVSVGLVSVLFALLDRVLLEFRRYSDMLCPVQQNAVVINPKNSEQL